VDAQRRGEGVALERAEHALQGRLTRRASCRQAQGTQQRGGLARPTRRWPAPRGGWPGSRRRPTSAAPTGCR
jgi:hypothetical protein